MDIVLFIKGTNTGEISGRYSFSAAGLFMNCILGFINGLVDFFTGLFHRPLGVNRVLNFLNGGFLFASEKTSCDQQAEGQNGQLF